MNFVVAGAGAWGTAFAVHLARLGHAVTLVPRRSEHAAALASSRINADYLPGVVLPSGITVAADPGPLAGIDAVLVACPAQVLRGIKAQAIAARQGLDWQQHRRIEQQHLTQTWLHDDHWAASEKLLSKGA